MNVIQICEQMRMLEKIIHIQTRQQSIKSWIIN